MTRPDKTEVPDPLVLEDLISDKLNERQKSKETFGQTRGLSNLEMKHVGKLAIIGALLKALKTSCVRTMQGRTYLV